MTVVESPLRSPRTVVKRLPDRGAYDRATIDPILDEGMICHVGFVADGQPFVLPTAYARVGDHVYIHGSAASRMLRSLAGGVPACLTVTLVDGLVLARSAFHHSMNYRAVVLLGTLARVDDAGERAMALDALVEHIVPGRNLETRPPNAKELKATAVLKMAITEASAKVRTGGPIDDAEDLMRPEWAGILPLRLTPHAPIADGALPAGTPLPEYIRSWRRGVPAGA